MKVEQDRLKQCEQAIIATVAYTDIFDYPLTLKEIYRFLIGVNLTLPQIQTIITERLLPTQLAHHNGYYSLPQRQEIFTTRSQRHRVAQSMWPHAIRYGRLLSRLPFVKMVAVTGSLAVDNVDSNADIDYFIITTHQRVWLCRALTILLVRYADRRGVILCPNYFVSEKSLALGNHSLYGARELAQMIPLFGFSHYQKLLQHNQWMTQYLPNAHPYTQTTLPDQVEQASPEQTGILKTVAEKLLQTPIGNWLEAWEQKRKIVKFSARSDSTETSFSPNWCKGHFDSHGEKILAHYNSKVRTLKTQ